MLTQCLFDFEPEEKKQMRRHVNAADRSVWRDEWPNKNPKRRGLAVRRTDGRRSSDSRRSAVATVSCDENQYGPRCIPGLRSILGPRCIPGPLHSCVMSLRPVLKT